MLMMLMMMKGDFDDELHTAKLRKGALHLRIQISVCF